jgi:hypothetical protein
MPLRPSYSQGLSRADRGTSDSAGPAVNAGSLRAKLGYRRRRVLASSGGLFVAASLGAGAMIFPERAEQLWQARDWFAPSVVWSLLGYKSAPSAKALEADNRGVEFASAEPRQGTVAPELEAAVMQTMSVSPLTTSSINILREKMKQSALVNEDPADQVFPIAPPSAETAAPAKVAAVAPAMEPSKTETRSDAEPSYVLLPEVTETLGRARALVDRGDIAGARLLLEHAAAKKDPRALLALGETYDPAMLSHWRARGIKGDLTKARELYEKAAETGFAEARARVLAFR